MKNPNVFLVQMQTFFEVNKLFSKFHCLSSYQNDFKSKQTGFHTPIYFFNESIILKNESFCVVCIITYVTVVLLFTNKDGSNTLYVILTCILLFTLFECCCFSIIVLTRWIGWLKQQQHVAKDKTYIFFLFCNTTSLVYI